MYPLAVIKKRLEKQVSPGVLCIDDRIFPATVTKQTTVSYGYIIFCSVLLVGLISAILFIVTTYYFNPYTALSKYEREVSAQVSKAEASYGNASLSAKLQTLGLEDWTTIQYPDGTMLVTIPAKGKFEDLVNAVSESKGILSLQFSNDTMYVILVKGAL